MHRFPSAYGGPHPLRLMRRTRTKRTNSGRTRAASRLGEVKTATGVDPAKGKGRASPAGAAEVAALRSMNSARKAGQILLSTWATPPSSWLRDPPISRRLAGIDKDDEGLAPGQRVELGIHGAEIFFRVSSPGVGRDRPASPMRNEERMRRFSETLRPRPSVHLASRLTPSTKKDDEVVRGVRIVSASSSKVDEVSRCSRGRAG